MSNRAYTCNVCVVFLLLFAGCAAYTGPRAQSTAYPSDNPPRPTPQQRQEIHHDVRPVNHSIATNRDTVSAAYAARGKPSVAVVFFDADNSIVIAPAVTAVVQSTSSVSAEASASATSGNAAASIEKKSTSVAGAAVVGTVSEHQLISWSDVQQAFFDTLHDYGVRMIDAETITLSTLDSLLRRTSQGLSLHTAELEQVRGAANFEILFVVQEVGSGSDVYLQGRVWDLRDGQLLAAERKRLRFGRDSETAKVVLQSSARSLATNLTGQAAEAWAKAK